jgi:hypothetical protein
VNELRRPFSVIPKPPILKSLDAIAAAQDAQKGARAGCPLSLLEILKSGV